MKGFFKRLGRLIFLWIAGIVGVMMLLGGSDMDPGFMVFGFVIIGVAALIFLTGFVPGLVKGTAKASIPAAKVTAKATAKIAAEAAKPSSTWRYLFTGKFKKDE